MKKVPFFSPDRSDILVVAGTNGHHKIKRRAGKVSDEIWDVLAPRKCKKNCFRMINIRISLGRKGHICDVNI